MDTKELKSVTEKLESYLNRTRTDKSIKNNLFSELQDKDELNLEPIEAVSLTAGADYYIESKKIVGMDFRSLCMAFQTLANCVKLSKKHKKDLGKFEKYWKNAGKKYSDEWIKRIQKAISNNKAAPDAKIFKTHKLIQDSDNIDSLINSKAKYKDYFNTLEIDDRTLEYIFKVYESAAKNKAQK